MVSSYVITIIAALAVPVCGASGRGFLMRALALIFLQTKHCREVPFNHDKKLVNTLHWVSKSCLVSLT